MNINKKIFLLFAIFFIVLSLPGWAQSERITVAQAFYELAHQNNPQKIERLLSRGYSIESIDEKGYSPVCLAIIKQDRTAYNNLLTYGANSKPTCLNNVPKESYRRFFGNYPLKKTTPAYVSDTPYVIGAVALGAGALATAYILRGDINSGSHGGGGGGGGGGGDDPEPPECTNGTYDAISKSCICDPGYDNYGDSKACYATIPDCQRQSKDACIRCKTGYTLSDNACYETIKHCAVQTGTICTECENGYGIYQGDGSICYTDIPECQIQVESTCSKCQSGYGTYGDDSNCYQTVEHCSNQILTACQQCDAGYSTYGNPNADACYDKNPCEEYEHTVPIGNKDEIQCICDEDKGYEGTPGNCSQVTDDGEYQEGEGNREEWNNWNEVYCHSHGKYNPLTELCSCYKGYASAEDGCSGCAEGYDYFGNNNGICYADINCDESKHLVQIYDQCVCAEGYLDYKGECIEVVTCPLHYEQTKPGTDPEEVCTCKQNFDENCENCIEGFHYVEETDSCIRNNYVCDENWTGLECNICPSQYKVTIDETGEHCNNVCAENRAPYDEFSNPNCSECALGYYFSPLDNNCILSACVDQQGNLLEGWILDEDGKCACDTANNYAMSRVGLCQKKEADLIGIEDRNINNSTIEVNNNGLTDGFRDVYGMKPTIKNGEETEYYESVYNALSSSSTQTGIININNMNTGANTVYGIYSPYAIYNAAAINLSTNNAVFAIGEVNINDNGTESIIYGLYNNTNSSIYNAFAFNNNSATEASPINSTANALVHITKDETSAGSIVGILGNGNILNSYADTTGGIASNVTSTGVIDIENSGSGEIIGIYGMNATGKVNNSLAYLDSAVSNAISTGQIRATGNGNVYGIYGSGTLVNSETQFKKSYNRINNLSSEGLIETTSLADRGTSYGIYAQNTGNIKVEIYNALGYNSIGNIIANNKAGGSAYGILNMSKIYEEEDEGRIVSYYTNVYNAFRSSAKYGGDNTEAKGNIEVNIEGLSLSPQNGVGIYTAGNVFNSYANSGSDVKLETIGNIKINDKSRTSSMMLKGIESEGATIANAYATGQNKNTETTVIGNIEINIKGNKHGSVGSAAGIFSNKPSTMVARVLNAALINDTSNVSGNITISSDSSTTLSKIYGIYASKYDISGGDPEEGHEKNVYNAYYYNEDNSISGGNVTGTINIYTANKSPSASAEYYGIFVNEGEAYNAYDSNDNYSNVTGTINVDVAGGENNGTAAGIYGNNASLYNFGINSSINVKTRREGNKAYGMKGDNSNIENGANINVISESSDAYGLYVINGEAINNSNGVINVSGKTGSYGIYVIAEDEKEAKATNAGTINLTGEGKNIGIYASGSGATVQNTGLIKINGDTDSSVCEDEECQTAAIQLVNGAKLHNGDGGEINGGDDLNLSAMGGEIILASNGKFSAKNSISGNINIASDTYMNNFDKEIVLEDALSAQDVSEVKLNTKSYMYTPEIIKKIDGKHDIAVKMKDFSAITNDRSEQAYFENNYAKEKNVTLFNELKKVTTASEMQKKKADLMGSSMLPNITEEELKIHRSLDRKMVGELFADGDDIRKIVGANASHLGRNNHQTLTGYKLNAQSTYALYDKKMDNRYRLGLGMSLTHTDTDYNNDSRRKNIIVQGYVPLTYNINNNLRAVSMARLGYASGDYKRRTYNDTYKADTKEISYGLLNEVRYTENMKYFSITPFIGLNAIGWYQNSIDEDNQALALHIDSTNIFSLEGALGLYIDKSIDFNENNRLNMALGIGYYHEFANPYNGIDAHHQEGALGKYKIKNRIISRDRGILSANLNYDYKDFSIYGTLMQYIEEEYPLEVEGGIKYKF